MFTVNLDNFAIPLLFFFRPAFGSKKINEISQQLPPEHWVPACLPKK